MSKTNILSEKSNNKRGTGARVFYWVMFALPLLQFFIFYICVNFNSILLAFQETTIVMDSTGVRYVTEFVGFKTIGNFLTTQLNSALFKIAIGNSLKYLVFSIVVVIPLGLLFSYYIFKKYTFSSLFRTFLFLPSVICSLILVIFFSYIADRVYPQIVLDITGKRPSGLLTSPNTSFLSIAFFSFFFSFGPSTLIYLNAMTQISSSVVEAAEIDGATGLKQFYYVVFPSIFSSVTSYIIICIAQVATNQLSGYSFFGASAGDTGAQTVGYLLFEMAARDNAKLVYPIASAGGILFTLVVAPITLVIRWLLEKYGPSEN